MLVENGNILTKKDLIDVLRTGWFSSKASTEVMISGMGNERAVFKALPASSFFMALFDVGIVAMKDSKNFACSPPFIYSRSWTMVQWL